MDYLTWRITFQDSEQAAKAAWKTVLEQQTKIRELEAELAALEKQEPVATYMGHRLTPEGTDEFWGMAKTRLPEGSELYLRPVPADPVRLSDSQLRTIITEAFHTVKYPFQRSDLDLHIARCVANAALSANGFKVED